MKVVLLNDGTPAHIGMIPYWLDEADMRNARDQLDDHYQHGGGWRPFEGFKLNRDHSIKYDGDPALKPLAIMKLRDEVIAIYDYGWVMILQPNDTFEICRMD